MAVVSRDTGDAALNRLRRPWRAGAILAVYLVLSVAATWPLPRDMTSLIASDPGDPVLNASILLWNATTVPFSPAWWNGPHYYPAEGVTGFTENLVGLSPFASPVYWLTGNPILAYNLALFLTWPLSAFAMYLLVRFITGREDAAFLAGLSYGFTPYRAVGLGHIQTLAVFGLPLVLLALHGFVEDRRRRWLFLLGAAWLQQSLANGYFMLFGGVVIALWLAYFCSTRRTWTAGLPIVAAWAVASLPLLPIMLKYRQIHEQYGLHRTENEILYFSATPQSWFETSGNVWLWHSVFPDGKDNLFPGVTAVTLVVAGICALLLRRRSEAQPAPGHRWLRAGLGVAAALGIAAVLVSLKFGQVDVTIAGIPIRMRNLNRALALIFLSGIPYILLTPRARDALARRSPLVFYVLATMLIALLCCGPVLRVGEDIVLSPAPYRWLMALPGFNELRIPTQFKMFGVLCLSASAGVAFVALRPSRSRAAPVLFAIALVGLLLDGWMAGAPMAAPPGRWAEVEPSDRPEPILELPIGPDWDYAATFRAAAHHRRVLNGVSGYDPPHYVALLAGLQARDPAMLTAIASLTPFDIVVNRQVDPDGALAKYASSAPGASRVADDGIRTTYRIPKAAAEEAPGEVLPIESVNAIRHEADWRLMHDGRIETGWGDYPQEPDAWIVIDLGSVRRVGGLTHAIGDYLLDFPRRLVIEVSADAVTWERAWEGSTASKTFLAYAREPRVAPLTFTFDARPARFVRLRQLERYRSMWRVSELQVHAPALPRSAARSGARPGAGS